MKQLKSILALIILIASSSGLAGQAEFTQDQFIAAIEKGADAKQVEEMLAKGADINKATPIGETSLMAAAFAGRPEVVQLLLERGADLHAKTSKGITALMAAAIAGKTEVIKLLLDKGMQVNEKDAAGSTALAKAAYNGKTEAVGLLLERGAFANATIDGVGDDRLYANHTPVLLMVTLKGAPEIVRMLLEHDADVNAKGRDGATPLMMAAVRGDAGMVKLMLDKGADVNAKGPQNATPLMFAAGGGSLDSAEILLKHGADRTLKDSAGKTALDVAKLTHHLAVAKLLESEKMPIAGLSLTGQNNMLQAIMDGADAKQVAEMLAQGADANKPDEKGWPPLLFAATKGSLEVVRLLLNKGADVNAKSPRGETALFIAVRNHATELTQLLVDKGADVNERQPDGNTLLNNAISEYKTELVKVGVLDCIDRAFSGRTNIVLAIEELRHDAIQWITQKCDVESAVGQAITGKDE